MMLRNVLPILLLITVGQFGYAQIGFGVKSGINYINNEAPALTDKPQYRFGYHLGVESSFKVNDKFSVLSELLYSDKGYKFNPTNGNDGNLHLSYLNIPIHFGWLVSNKLRFSTGVEIGYLLSSKIKGRSGTSDGSVIWNKKIDFGPLINVSYCLTDKLDLGLRYIHGLTTVASPPKFLGSNTSGVMTIVSRNRAIQLSLTYRLKNI